MLASYKMTLTRKIGIQIRKCLQFHNERRRAARSVNIS